MSQQLVPEVGMTPLSLDAIVERNAWYLQQTTPNTVEHRQALRHYFVSVVAQQLPGLFSEVEYESERSAHERIQQALEAGLGEVSEASLLLDVQDNWNLYFIRQISARLEFRGDAPRTFPELLYRLEGVNGEAPTAWFRA